MINEAAMIAENEFITRRYAPARGHRSQNHIR
jgi:hypothetical protein